VNGKESFCECGQGKKFLNLVGGPPNVERPKFPGGRKKGTGKKFKKKKNQKAGGLHLPDTVKKG